MGKSHWGLAIAVGTLWLAAGVPPAAAVDEVLLAEGGRLRGDVDDAGLTLLTPRGAYKVSRERVWRVVLGEGPAGDAVDLRNGNHLSGRVDRGAYTVRVAGGEARTLRRTEIAMITLGRAGTARGPSQADVVVLTSGDHVYGGVVGSDVELRLPTGSARFARDTLWQIVLNSAAGDTVVLGNGTQLSGVVDQAYYEVKTPDGQTLTFGRDEIKAIYFPPPVRPLAAAPADGRLAATPAPSTTGTAAPIPQAALPPAIRAVLRDLQFEFDRWELIPESRRTLEELATAMKAYPNLQLTIEGHADERGTSEYNLALGARRSESARDYLVSLGVAAERLQTISYGEERPVDPGHTEMAWAVNRRAHFVVKAP